MAEVAIRTENLSVSFAGFRAVDGVDLSVEAGTIHALIGPNGAGKTTCFNLITKFIRPSSGRIWLGEQDITALEPDAVARLGMVRSFQISAVFPGLSVLENVRVALQPTLGVTFQFWRSNRILRRLDDQAMALLDRVGMAAVAGERAADLSYGRKRVLEIATTLALDPSVLLLDEPMAGMGAEDVAMVANLIREVGRNRTILMVEHNLSVVADLSDRITVLQRGQILAEGSYAEVSSDRRVIEAYMGEEVTDA
ncbi:ABC transporter ATP-binding protein [Oceanibacterium hippocampi]|uniref:Lipopolysaccharide export system ATP-binding protein LptB n=1 Tax=Oceanibacterium hippocampi TaxID=745714 RepID=A0A1Y5U4E2_9PROT|nr:ABC transporter ATP-binding protein [Oceanibacterium hippocampi]SLN76660.1 Lipopolysaccharide export system ATP-binding protein LptB [Oceanibacterium hippocampi]